MTSKSPPGSNGGRRGSRSATTTRTSQPAVTRQRVTDGLFVHTLVTADAQAPVPEFVAALTTLLQAAAPQQRLQAIIEQVQSLKPRDGEEDVFALRRDRILDKVAGAQAANPDTLHYLDLIDLAQLELREFRLYLEVVPHARAGRKQLQHTSDGGNQRARQYAPLRAWAIAAASRLRVANPMLKPSAIKRRLVTAINAEFALHATPEHSRQHPPPLKPTSPP